MLNREDKPLDLERYTTYGGDLYDLILAVATEFAASLNATLHHDETALLHSISRFQNDFPSYWHGLIDGAPSHIKMFGQLLHYLTQLPASDDETQRLQSFGLSGVRISSAIIPDNEKRLEIEELFETFGNDAIMFMFVYYEFHRVQRQRKAQTRIPVSPPPLHFRYFRAMIDYLRPMDDPRVAGIRSPYDLYMVLKSMDLILVDTDYGSGQIG